MRHRRRPSQLLGCFILGVWAWVAAPAHAEVLRLDVHSTHHVSASQGDERNGIIMHGGGVRGGWPLRRWLTAELGVDVVGYRLQPVLARLAVPIALGARFEPFHWEPIRPTARLAMALAPEWLTLGTGAGVYARKTFATVRVSVGLGIELLVRRYLRVPCSAGVDLSLVNATRTTLWDGKSWQGVTESPVPKQAGGAELQAVVACELGPAAP